MTQEIEKEIEKIIETANALQKFQKEKPQFCISKCNVNKANNYRFATIKSECNISENDPVFILKIENSFENIFQLMKAMESVLKEQKIIQQLRESDEYFDSIDGKRISSEEEHKEWMRRNNTIPIIKKEDDKWIKLNF